MHTRSRTVVLLSLICLLMLTPLLSGCGAIGAVKQVADAAKELATKAPDLAKEAATQVAESSEGEQVEPTEAVAEEPTAEAQSEESGADTALENPLNNLLTIGSVHVTSSYWVKEAGTVTQEGSMEGDIDAKGSQHMLLTGTQVAEVYVIDGNLYMKNKGEEQFMPLEGVAKDTPFLYLMGYGGLYALGVGTEDASKVGSETVNGFQCDKYQINWDTLGAAALAGAAGMKYEGYAWIDKASKSLIKSQFDWTVAAQGNTPEQAYHSDFSVTKATVAEITPPENVINLGAMTGSEG